MFYLSYSSIIFGIFSKSSKYLIIKEINNLKLKHNYNLINVKELRTNFQVLMVLQSLNLKFSFKMLNIAKDDGVVLKYLWRDKYENTSLNLFMTLQEMMDLV